MKKLFALLMALCLMLCACAYAEETAEINWADVEEKAAQIEGQFAPIADLGVMVYIPSIFGSVELSDEQKQIINRKLHDLQEHIQSAPCVTVVFFQPDARKVGGTYRTVSGCVKKVNDTLAVLEMADGLSIPFQDILSLDE